MAGTAALLAAALLLLACGAARAAAATAPAGEPAVAAPGAALPEDLTLVYGDENEEWRGKVVRLSWKPRAYLFKHFLTEAECDHLVSLSKGKLTKSTVVDADTGKPMDSDVRTSSGTFFQRGHDEIITRIEERVAAASMMPMSNQEGLQILHYQDGEKYEPHTDWFREDFNQDEHHGGQRYITVLMYLSTPEEGGETVFPMAEYKSTGADLSECAKKGLANKPYKGDALLFYSLTPDGKEDELSTHGSCPTLKGEKWSATKWIHVRPYGGTAAEQKAKWGDCLDTNPQCPGWAARGECKSNPTFMLSSCRLSCGMCKGKKAVV